MKGLLEDLSESDKPRKNVTSPSKLDTDTVFLPFYKRGGFLYNFSMKRRRFIGDEDCQG